MDLIFPLESHASIGPTFWGLNSDWIMCDKGRRQSPIDIQTSAIVHDPHLDSLRADSNLVSHFLDPVRPSQPQTHAQI